MKVFKNEFEKETILIINPNELVAIINALEIATKIHNNLIWKQLNEQLPNPNETDC